jgi:hypothetical protein
MKLKSSWPSRVAGEAVEDAARAVNDAGRAVADAGRAVSAIPEAFCAWGAPLIIDPGAILINTAAVAAENCQIAFIMLLCRRESG